VEMFAGGWSVCAGVKSVCSGECVLERRMRMERRVSAGVESVCGLKSALGSGECMRPEECVREWRVRAGAESACGSGVRAERRVCGSGECVPGWSEECVRVRRVSCSEVYASVECVLE
jgi:hypothetical protein